MAYLGTIDFAQVKTKADLMAWAIRTFEFDWSGEISNDIPTGEDGFFMGLFNHIGAKKIWLGKILEMNKECITPEVDSVLNDSPWGWKQALGFHLHREWGASVIFVHEE